MSYLPSSPGGGHALPPYARRLWRALGRAAAQWVPTPCSMKPHPATNVVACGMPLGGAASRSCGTEVLWRGGGGMPARAAAAGLGTVCRASANAAGGG